MIPSGIEAGLNVTIAAPVSVLVPPKSMSTINTPWSPDAAIVPSQG